MTDTVIDHDQTHAAEQEQFVRDGYVFLRGVIPPDVVERAVHVLERSAAPALASKEFESQGPNEESAAALAACAEAASSVVAHFLAGPATPDPQPFGFAIHAPRPHTPDAHWAIHYAHTDQAHPLFLTEHEKLNAFVFLTRVRSQGGAFCFAPGSPARFRRWQSAHAFESVHSRARNPELAGPLIECEADPGDVIIYDNSMVHSTSDNVTGPTRYALRVGFMGLPRWRPADRSVDELSAVERAMSIRHLASAHDDVNAVDVGPTSDDDLATGFGPVSAHALLRIDGNIVRFWVDPRTPTVIERSSTTDLVSWHDLAPLLFADQPIVSLATEYRYEPTLTVVTRSATGHTCTKHLYADQDDTWTEVFAVDGAMVSRPHFILESAVNSSYANHAQGEILYVVSDDDRATVSWRSGGVTIGPAGGREAFSNWRTGPAAHTASAPLTDVVVIPNGQFAPVLVADVEGIAHHSHSTLADLFAEPLAPFTHDGDDPPSQIRLVERSESYWLVTYRAGDRVRWGAVDWLSRPGHLSHLATRDAVQQGFENIGLA